MQSCGNIGEHTLSQLNAILERLPEQLEIRVGMPGIFGGGGVAGQGEGRESGKAKDGQNGTSQKGKPPKLSEIMNFCSGFGGGGA